MGRETGGGGGTGGKIDFYSLGRRCPFRFPCGESTRIRAVWSLARDPRRTWCALAKNAHPKTAFCHY